MSTELVTITSYRQKDARLHEAQVQRFAELPENTEVQVEFKIVSEAKFGKAKADNSENFINAILKIEATFMLPTADAIKSVGCKVIVAYQGVFAFDEEFDVAPLSLEADWLPAV